MGARMMAVSVLTGAAFAFSAAAGAATFTPAAGPGTTWTPADGHALQIAMTREVVGREGDHLFFGLLGYNNHIVPGTDWFRQDATSLVVGTNPSGGLGHAPGPAQVLFASLQPSTTFPALPSFTLDGTAQSGDRIDMPASEGRTVRAFVTGTNVTTNVVGPSGAALTGSAIAVASATDIRAAMATPTGPTFTYQTPEAPPLPPAEAVSAARQKVEVASRALHDFPDPIFAQLLPRAPKVAVYPAKTRSATRKRYRVVYGNLALTLTRINASFALDDYKAVAGAAAQLQQLDKQLKAADTAVKKTFKVSPPRTKLLKKTHLVYETVGDAAFDLQSLVLK